MDILKHLKTQYSHAVQKRCEEEGCKINLSDLKEYIILKGEELNPQKTICDCIIFLKRKTLIVGVVELKSGTTHASEVVNQLKSGLEFVFKNMKGSAVDKVRVIVLAKKWKKSEYNKITKTKIEIYGKKYPILPKRCGTYFSEIISKY